MKWRISTVASLLVILSVGAGTVSAQQLYYSGSAQGSAGSYYFDEVTRSLSLHNGLSYHRPRYRVSVNVPFLIQSTPWVSHGGAGALPTGGPQHDQVFHQTGRGSGGMGGGRHISLQDTVDWFQSGFSDPTLSAAYLLYRSGGGSTAVYFESAVKFPVASTSRGFGTGAWDYSAGMSLSHQAGNWSLMGQTAWWHLGDLPDLPLKNVWTWGAGVGRMFPQSGWMLTGMLNGMTEIINGIGPPVSAGLGIGFSTGPQVTLNLNASVGLTNAAADLALGLGFQVRVN